MNSVLGLPTKVLLQVVHYYGPLEMATRASQILNEHNLRGVVVLQLHGVLSIKTVLYET